VKSQDLDAALLRGTREEAARQAELVGARARSADAAQSRAAAARIEGELGGWNLLSKALGNDGVIGLCIDDAGPELARLANELLLACYGPRFTVSIRTQVPTVKNELREGFDVVVFDADTGQAKSVGVMSGGERIFINEALTRAIALYLARASGRRYETLFCEEADGALDSERKRMFMHMKREVLRLGGYAREYFVSQTPELTQMADVVIDLVALAKAGAASIAPAAISHAAISY
jgi:exonuclease SbcC